ncbi:TPA: acetyltransferase [Citrobacter amalonaticus]|nr:acetyltransferase [Citrobacter amalonaticus]
MNKIARKNILLGAGGHAAVLFDILEQNGETVHCIVAREVPNDRPLFRHTEVINDDEFLTRFHPDDVLIVNGIGIVPHSSRREHLYRHYTALGYSFKNIISKQAIVSPFATLGEGAQILPGAIVQTGADIGENSIINSRAVIEHDGVIGRHNHIAPGAILCGAVTTGMGTFIGAGAIVIPTMTVGDSVVIGAGEVIKKDIASHSVVCSERPHFSHDSGL